jgi:hypothetical protein
MRRAVVWIRPRVGERELESLSGQKEAARDAFLLLERVKWTVYPVNIGRVIGGDCVRNRIIVGPDDLV